MVGLIWSLIVIQSPICHHGLHYNRDNALVFMSLQMWKRCKHRILNYNFDIAINFVIVSKRVGWTVSSTLLCGGGGGWGGVI